MNSDEDSHGDVCDNCPNIDNEAQTSTDGDGYGDACDNCPGLANGQGTDTNEDGEDDICEPAGTCFDSMSNWVPPNSDVAVDETRFSRQGGMGVGAANPDPDEPIVIDSLTELQWQGCLIGLKGPSCETSTAPSSGYAAETYNTHRTACEYSDWGGYGDWRLPTIQELTSLPDYYYGNPGLPPAAVFPGLVSYPWSKTQPYPSAYYFFSMHFDSTAGYGGRTYSADPNSDYAAICVRAGATTDRCFEVESEGGEEIVKDATAQLMWQRGYWGSNDSVSWVYAPANYGYHTYPVTDICGSNTFGGYSDWRMPSITELFSLMYFDGSSGEGLPAEVFDIPTEYEDCFWSKSLVEDGDYTTRWVYVHNTGLINVKNSDSNACFVRCVRDYSP